MKGFTLIDVLVGTFLMLIVFLGIFGAFQLSIKVVTQSQAKITASALANQKIEQARNLSYNDVGTIGGVVPGKIPEIENISLNNIDYTVKTTVWYIDDSFDGVAPDDQNPADYKRIKVRCFWENRVSGEVFLITDVTPKGVETTITGGTLLIIVFDAEGIGVSQANVHIVNTLVDPSIDANYSTGVNGELLFPGASVSVEGYQITVTKSGYSTSRTYGVEEVANPSKPHASVYEGDLTEIGFAIDVLRSMTVQARGTKGAGYPPVHNVIFSLTGAKIIGTDLNGDPVYKYSQNHITDGKAEIEIPNLEWDSYTFSVDKAVTGLDLTGIESPPETEISQPVDLLPDTDLTVRFVLKAENTLLLTVNNANTQEPIFGASVRLYNVDLGYDEILPTDGQGEAFFIPLEEAIYDLEVQAEGYQTFSDTIPVSDDTTKTVNLILYE